MIAFIEQLIRDTESASSFISKDFFVEVHAVALVYKCWNEEEPVEV